MKETIKKQLKGSAKEIRSLIRDFMSMSKEGYGRRLNDYICGVDANGDFLWIIQLCEDYDTSRDEYSRINLRSSELVEVDIWQECPDGGIETIYA